MSVCVCVCACVYESGKQKQRVGERVEGSGRNWSTGVRGGRGMVTGTGGGTS